MRTSAALLAIAITLAVSTRCAAAEVVDAAVVSPSPEAALVRRFVVMQKSGLSLLGGGLGLLVGGAILIEVDPYGEVGMAGFVTVGTGIALWTTAMFLLGFSRPVHGEIIEDPPLVVAGVTAHGDGFVIGYGKRF